MAEVIWFRGVPWDAQALESARKEQDPGLVEVVTEIARTIRLTRANRPEPGGRVEGERGRWKALLSGELVVMGYGRADEGSPGASDGPGGTSSPGDQSEAPRKRKNKGRGPKSVAELIAWLEDEGYMVDIRTGTNHPAVLSPTGVRLVTLPLTPGDVRSIKNSVAICRRVLNLDLRRPQ